MKRIIITLITLAIAEAVLLSSCSKETIMNGIEGTYLDNISTTDCVYHTDTLAANDMNTDSITVVYNDILTVTHSNMPLDCEMEKHIVTTMQVDGDTITVTEDVGEQGLVNCICLYNNSFDIANLPSHPFTLIIKEVYVFQNTPAQRIVYQHRFLQ